MWYVLSEAHWLQDLEKFPYVPFGMFSDLTLKQTKLTFLYTEMSKQNQDSGKEIKSRRNIKNFSQCRKHWKSSLGVIGKLMWKNERTRWKGKSVYKINPVNRRLGSRRQLELIDKIQSEKLPEKINVSAGWGREKRKTTTNPTTVKSFQKYHVLQ